jgi:hypothetical protein
MITIERDMLDGYVTKSDKELSYITQTFGDVRLTLSTYDNSWKFTPKGQNAGRSKENAAVYISAIARGADIRVSCTPPSPSDSLAYFSRRRDKRKSDDPAQTKSDHMLTEILSGKDSVAVAKLSRIPEERQTQGYCTRCRRHRCPIYKPAYDRGSVVSVNANSDGPKLGMRREHQYLTHVKPSHRPMC